MYLVLFPFDFEGRIWDLILSVPDHFLSFYLLFKGDDILFNSHDSHNWNTGAGYTASVGAFWK